MKTRTHILASFITVLSLCLATPVCSQTGLTLYGMQGIPQSNYNNPALQPDCRLHIGCMPIIPVPLMSSFYTAVNHNGFFYDDLIRDNGNEKLEVDIDGAIENLARVNYFSAQMNLELLSFGFKVKHHHYISLGINEKVHFRFSYPRDLVSLMWHGNSQFAGSSADLSGLGLDWNHYRELSLGYAYNGARSWTIGTRLKLLFGMSNVWTQRMEASVGIDETYYDHTIQSEMTVNIAAEEMLMTRISDYFSGASGSRGFDISKYNIADYALNLKNPGGALDIGLSCNIGNHFSFSFSALDLGFIWWKSGAINFRIPDNTIVFEGLDIAEILRNENSGSGQNGFTEMLDSIFEPYQIQVSNNPYVAPLNPVLFAGFFYAPDLKSKLNLMTRAEIFKGSIHPAFTLAYIRKFGNAASFSVNYSYMNRNWLNAGFGGAFKMGPLQFFIATDNILSAFIPHKTGNVSLYAGCNWVFYTKTSRPLMAAGN
jgi:hypothetical protein